MANPNAAWPAPTSATPPPPLPAAPAIFPLMHVAQKHVLGLEPRVRSVLQYGVHNFKKLSAPHASHESIPARRASGSYIGYAVTPPRPVFCAVIQGIAAETSSRILADLAKPAKASRATEMGTWPS